MSFNLNKNEESADVSKKSTFDLSKSDQEIPAQLVKTRTGWYALTALVLTGALVWYFTRPSAVVSQPAKVKTENTAIGDTAHPLAATSPQPTASNFSSDVPVLAASFSAGSVAPNIEEELFSTVKSHIKAGRKIRVVGYASSEGAFSVNQTISQARADAYKAFLIQNGVPEESINTEGKGIDNPIADNDTEAGRAKNRRVEVSFN